MPTVDVSYVPGALTAVVGDQCWALVEVTPDSPAVARTWQRLGQGATADALLAGLVADGLDGTAGFTLLVAGTGGQHRLFCRGTVGATVVRDAAAAGTGNGQATATRVNGAGLLTWREQVIEGADRIFLGPAPPDSALRLPAASGVLLAGSVIIDLTNAAGRETVSYEQDQPGPQELGNPQEQVNPQEPGKRKKTIVFFPDTITMTHPGSLADRAAAGLARPDAPGSGAFPAPAPPMPAGPAQPFGPVRTDAPGSGCLPASPARSARRAAGAPARTVADGPAWPAGEDDVASPGPFAPGGAPVAGGYPGAGGQPAAQYRVTAPPDAQPWQPVSDGAWSGGPPPGAPLPGPVLPSAPLPGRAQNPAGGMPQHGMSPGLIDAPPWLAGPGGPAPGGQPPLGLAPLGQPPTGPGPNTGMPTSQVPLGQAPACPVPLAPGPVDAPYQPAQYQPTQPQPIQPRPSQPGAPRVDPGPGESGSTVKRGELPEYVAVTSPPDRIGPVVPALLCPSGHVNPPSGATCRRCGAPLPHDPVPVPRPVLGVLRLSLGDVIALDRGVLMGRNPRTDFAGTDGEERPHVVKLPSADGDISRTHLRVTLDGWHVLVTDLNSTNGTLVTLPGRDPQQLRPGEPVPIQPGTVVTLAEGIDFRYEVAE